MNPAPDLIHFKTVEVTGDEPATKWLVARQADYLPNEEVIVYTLGLWNIVSYVKGGKKIKDIWEQDLNANIWAQEGWEWVLKIKQGRTCSQNEKS